LKFLGERIGNLSIISRNPTNLEAVKSQLVVLATIHYLNPPSHGGRIVEKILKDENLKQEWLKNLKFMSARIAKMRRLLYDNLVVLKTPGNWNHILGQIGMFSYTGLKGKVVKNLLERSYFGTPCILRQEIFRRKFLVH
jgi:aspartate aminotransferase